MHSPRTFPLKCILTYLPPLILSKIKQLLPSLAYLPIASRQTQNCALYTLTLYSYSVKTVHLLLYTFTFLARSYFLEKENKHRGIFKDRTYNDDPMQYCEIRDETRWMGRWDDVAEKITWQDGLRCRRKARRITETHVTNEEISVFIEKKH